MFNNLLNELLIKPKPVMPKVIAWWITPNDKKLDAHGERDHYKVVAENPKAFRMNVNDPLLRSPERNEHRIVAEAVRNGAIRLVSAPTAYFIDSTRIDKETIDRIWAALPNLNDKELIWDCKVPFRGHTGWRGRLEELEGLIESVNETHSPKTCMDCKEPPTKEVLWAEGMGHAWFCEKHFNEWRAKHKDDINSIKTIKDGTAAKEFSDNHNPNEIKETTELGSGGLSLGMQTISLYENLKTINNLNEEDLFAPPDENELKQRKADKYTAQIRDALDKCQVTQNSDGTVDVVGKLSLTYQKIGSLEYLPVKIRKVSGSFNVSRCELGTLKGCPREIGPKVEGDKEYYGSSEIGFNCSDNHIKSLEGGPEVINTLYNCSSNKLLTSLHGAPRIINGGFLCQNTAITSLEGAPETVKGVFNASDNKELVSLKGLPKIIQGTLDLTDCPNLFDFTPLNDTTVHGETFVSVRSGFDMKKLDWRHLRLRKGVKLKEASGQVVEAFESDILRFLRSSQNLSDRHGMDRLGLQFDKITDDDITVIDDPAVALKQIAKGAYNDYTLFWVVTKLDTLKQDKLFATRDYSRRGRQSSPLDRVHLPHLLAISNGSEKTFDSNAFKHISLKATAGLADMVIAVPTAKFSSAGIQAKRAEAQKGLAAPVQDIRGFSGKTGYQNGYGWRDPKEDRRSGYDASVSRANKERYAEFLHNRHASVDFKQIVKDFATDLHNVLLGVALGEIPSLEDYKIYNQKSYEDWSKKKRELINQMLDNLYGKIGSYNDASRSAENPKNAESQQYYLDKMAEIKQKVIGAYNFFKEKKLDASFEGY